ncbi:MAG TPA: VanZ family protein [Pseudogracilibacillus sp.]|nr:VanZ family protein [Pseudogracilibacillus sp.]
MIYILHYGLFFLIYFGYFFPLWQQSTRNKLTIHIMMFSYISLVLSFTVIPIAIPFNYNYPNLWQSINVIPFRDVIKGYGFASREIVLNTMMLIPFGFLFPLLTNLNGMRTIMASCLFSITIETTQLMTILFATAHPRVVDVTDIITNTTGGSFGYLLYIIFSCLLKGKYSQ